MFGGELMKQNKTAMVIGIIYVVIAYLILRYLVPNDISLGTYPLVIVGGPVLINILFTYILKYDYFDKDNKEE
jgi:hypothetical protein